MSSCLRRTHVSLLKKRTCLLVEQEHMSSCWTRRHVFLFNQKHVFLLNKKTCLLVKEYHHLRTIWEAPGGSRRLQEAPGGSRKLQEAPGGSRRLREAKSDTPLSYNAKSSLKCQYYIMFLRVPFTLTTYLQ